MCGIAVPENVQGRSLKPLLTGERSASWRTYAFAENIIPEVINSGTLDFTYAPGKGVGGIEHPDAKMVRSNRWKLNYYPGHGRELYDLVNDPGETRNRIGQSGVRMVESELTQALLDWMITADERDQIARRWLG
jgi:hypothetical protein